MDALRLLQCCRACIIVHAYCSSGDANDRCGRCTRAEADAPLPTGDPVGAIPRDYNFAADILDRNLKAGRADKPAFIDPRGSWTYGQLADRVARFAASCARSACGARSAC